MSGRSRRGGHGQQGGGFHGIVGGYSQEYSGQGGAPVGSGELLREAKEGMAGAVIRVEGLELGVCLKLNLLQCLARPRLVDNASVSAAAMRAAAVALSVVILLLGSVP